MEAVCKVVGFGNRLGQAIGCAVVCLEHIEDFFFLFLGVLISFSFIIGFLGSWLVYR